MRRSALRTFCLVTILSVFTLIANTVSTLAASSFEQANRLYEQAEYEDAAAIYESVINSGRTSSAVFFNLGNTYLKNGQLGRALLNYRTAERLAPRDPDIQANLRFVRERVPDAFSERPSQWARPAGFFTLNELTAACTFLFWLWAAVFCATRFRPELKSRLRTVGLACGILLGITAIFLGVVYSQSRERVALVVIPQATVHLGPVAESQPAFTAPDGAELPILARREGWLQVRDRSNRSGWIPATNIVIFPPN